MKRSASAAYGVLVAGVVACGALAYWSWMRAGAQGSDGGYVEAMQALALSNLETLHGDRLEEENAWPRLVHVLEMPARAVPAGVIADFSMVYAAWTGEDVPESAPAMREAALAAMPRLEELGFFDAMDELARRRHVLPPAMPRPLLDWSYPEHQQMREAARVLAAQMFVAGASGDIEEAVRCFERMLALARIAGAMPGRDSGLMAGALIGLACHQTRVQILTREVAPEQLRELAAAIERQAPMPRLAYLLEGHTLRATDALMWAWENGQLPATLGGGGLSGRESTARQREAAFIESETKRLRALGKLPTWEASRMLAQRPIDVPEGYVVAGFVLGPLSLEVNYRASVEAVLDGLRIMIAIELVRAETGAYPAALGALVPDYLADLPRDPYSGEAFVYRLLGRGEDPLGRAFLLYSVGLDREDNGGRVHERGAWMAGQSRGAGFDLVINEHEER